MPGDRPLGCPSCGISPALVQWTGTAVPGGMMKPALACAFVLASACYTGPATTPYVVPEDVYRDTVVTPDGAVLGPTARGWRYLLSTDSTHRLSARGDEVMIEYVFTGPEVVLPEAVDESGRASLLKAQPITNGYAVEVLVPLAYVREMAEEGIVLSVRMQKVRNENGDVVNVPRWEPPVRPVYLEGFLRRVDEGR